MISAPRADNADVNMSAHSRKPELRRGNRGSAPEGRKCAGEALGALPKVGNAPWKQREHSRSTKTRRARLWERSRRPETRRSGYMPCDKANGSARLMLLCRKNTLQVYVVQEYEDFLPGCSLRRYRTRKEKLRSGQGNRSYKKVYIIAPLYTSGRRAATQKIAPYAQARHVRKTGRYGRLGASIL